MRGKSAGTALMLVGLCLIVVAVGLIFYNLWDDDRASVSAEVAAAEIHSVMPERIVPASDFSPENLMLIDPTDPTLEVPYYVVNPEIEMLEQEIDGISYVGMLSIPALSLELPVISQWSNANARIAPCRYQGSAYLDDLVICAHNYESHFGKLNTLSMGETVLFTDMEGNQFRYYILEFEVLDGTAIEEMCTGDWDLTLFTCTIGGRSRVAVRCEKIV